MAGKKRKEKQGGTLTKLSPTPRRTGLKKKKREENSGSIIGDSARGTMFEKSGSTAGSVDGSANWFNWSFFTLRYVTLRYVLDAFPWKTGHLDESHDVRGELFFYFNSSLYLSAVPCSLQAESFRSFSPLEYILIPSMLEVLTTIRV